MDKPQVFVMGIIMGAAVALLVVITSGSMSYLTHARQDYKRCIEDGGSESHCVDKYFKEQKP